MLLLNDQVHQYLAVKYDGWLLNYLPNVWRIWLLFYGSFSLAAATILYSAFCPQEVKLYSSAFEMADAEAKHHFNINEASIVQRETRAMYLQMPRWMYSYFDMNNMNHEIDVGTFPNPEAYLSKFLILRWRIQDMQRRGLRILLYVLFSVGLSLIGVPAALTFLQVTSIPLRNLWP
ncbi:hypothetical protein ACQR13_27755 [Bradyrhizobium sp. HKCCYLRH3059]|uniref:hypothetical protein n=1 Tax=Bradyrhizobium sp. HKCCYLRH3059 TaxID=3420745 RepID=UPI003EBF3471